VRGEYEICVPFHEKCGEINVSLSFCFIYTHPRSLMHHSVLAVNDVPELYWKSPPVTNENKEVQNWLTQMACPSAASHCNDHSSFTLKKRQNIVDLFILLSFFFAWPLIMLVFSRVTLTTHHPLRAQLLLPNLFIDDVDIIEDFTGRIAVNVSIRYGLLRMYAITGCMLLRCARHV
jgi:hypothetical protein